MSCVDWKGGGPPGRETPDRIPRDTKQRVPAFATLGQLGEAGRVQAWHRSWASFLFVGIQSYLLRRYLDSPNLHDSVEHITVPEKVRLDPYRV